MIPTPSRTDIIVSMLLIGGAFIAGALCALAGAAVAFAAMRGCAA